MTRYILKAGYGKVYRMYYNVSECISGLDHQLMQCPASGFSRRGLRTREDYSVWAERSHHDLITARSKEPGQFFYSAFYLNASVFYSFDFSAFPSSDSLKFWVIADLNQELLHDGVIHQSWSNSRSYARILEFRVTPLNSRIRKIHLCAK